MLSSCTTCRVSRGYAIYRFRCSRDHHLSACAPVVSLGGTKTLCVLFSVAHCLFARSRAQQAHYAVTVPRLARMIRRWPCFASVQPNPHKLHSLMAKHCQQKPGIDRCNRLCGARRFPLPDHRLYARRSRRAVPEKSKRRPALVLSVRMLARCPTHTQSTLHISRKDGPRLKGLCLVQ